MKNKKLLDSFIKPEDRLAAAAKKDLAVLSLFARMTARRVEPSQNYSSINLISLKRHLNEIIAKSSVIVVVKSFYSHVPKYDWIRYCKYTCEVIDDLAIQILDNYNKTGYKVTPIKNKVFDNNKFKENLLSGKWNIRE
jgi:hypothetical protein